MGIFLSGDYNRKKSKLINKNTKIDNTKTADLLDIIFHHHGYIYGGYVNKTLLRNESTSDIDVCIDKNNLDKLKIDLINKCHCRELSSHKYKLFRNTSKTAYLLCPAGPVDIFDLDIARKRYANTRSYFQSIVYTNNRYLHILDIDNPTELHKQEKDKIMDDIRNRRYKPWSDMREKDREYLKDWTITN